MPLSGNRIPVLISILALEMDLEGRPECPFYFLLCDLCDLCGESVRTLR